MTLRDALGELRWPILLSVVSTLTLGLVAYLSFAENPARHGCHQLTATFGCPRNDVPYGGLAAIAVIALSLTAAALALIAAINPVSHELRRVSLVVFAASFLPLAGLAVVAGLAA